MGSLDREDGWERVMKWMVEGEIGEGMAYLVGKMARNSVRRDGGHYSASDLGRRCEGRSDGGESARRR